ALAEALQSSKCQLTSLYLDVAYIGDEGSNKLDESLQNPNCKLTTLHLQYNEVGFEEVKAFAKALQSTNCKLTSLDLSNNEIDCEGLQLLAEALQHPSCKLTSLNLYGNRISDEGVKGLARSLQHSNCQLTALDLDNNYVGDEGAKALVGSLQYPSCKLVSLGLKNNNSIDGEAVYLSLCSSISLTSLRIDGLDAADTLVERNKKIQRLLEDVRYGELMGRYNVNIDLRNLIDSEPKVTGWGKVYIEAVTGRVSYEPEDEERWIAAIDTILQSDDLVIDLLLSQAIEDLAMRMKQSEPKKEIEALAYFCATPNIEGHTVADALPSYLCELIESPPSSSHGEVSIFSDEIQLLEVKQVTIPEGLFSTSQDGLSDWIEAVNNLDHSPINDAFKEALTELLSHVLKAQKSIGIAESRQMIALQGLTILEGLELLEPLAKRRRL
ncbi:MAG: hypothetical protein VXW87_04765, partial [Pseudomonadota bacterium]|nr:hypothetical protein [Pseudomonadota bacterium]